MTILMSIRWRDKKKKKICLMSDIPLWRVSSMLTRPLHTCLVWVHVSPFSTPDRVPLRHANFYFAPHPTSRTLPFFTSLVVLAGCLKKKCFCIYQEKLAHFNVLVFRLVGLRFRKFQLFEKKNGISFYNFWGGVLWSSSEQIYFSRDEEFWLLGSS